MTTLLEIVKNQPIEGFTDKLLYGGQMLLIGMATVFSVLVLLWGCLVVFKIIFHDVHAKRKSEASIQKSVEAAPTEAAAPVIGTDSEIVAVIAAAIAASEGAASTDGFVVRSIRKVRR